MNKDFNELSKKAYDEKAKDYENTFDGKFTVKFKELLAKNVELEDGDKVLDVACGTGKLLSMLGNNNNIQRFGVDISTQMIEVAKSRYEGYNFSVSDCTKLVFECNYFDAITVSAAFHHFPHPEEFLVEAHRVLKVKGKIYIAEIRLPIIIRQICNLILPHLNMGDVKIYTKKELEKMLDRNGFKSISHIKKGKIQLIIGESK